MTGAISRLALTAVEPVDSQTNLFGGADTPIYPAFDRKRGDELRSYRLDRSIGSNRAAQLLGISTIELDGCEAGRWRFDMELAKRLLRAGVGA